MAREFIANTQYGDLAERQNLALCSATLRLIMAFSLVLPLALASSATPTTTHAPEPRRGCCRTSPSGWSLDVVNDGDAPVDTLAVVSIAGRFANRAAVSRNARDRRAASAQACALQGRIRVRAPPSFLPSQIDDLDGNGTARRARASDGARPETSRGESTSTTPPRCATNCRGRSGFTRATRSATTARPPRSSPRRSAIAPTAASFSTSRADAEGQTGLHNTLLGYVGSRQGTSAGRDVHSSGRYAGTRRPLPASAAPPARPPTRPVVVRPPLNVPDYAHKPSPPDVPVYRVIASGPLRAIVEARLDRWRISESETVSVRATYTIAAGAAHVECRFQIATAAARPRI